jgi:hypothetical protein
MSSAIWNKLADVRQSQNVQEVVARLEGPLQTIQQHLHRADVGTVIGTILLLFTAWIVLTIVYRLTWHPLARFPGPFLCRISWWQQCYYEAILDGRFLERLPEYHAKYGNIRSAIDFMGY